MCLVVDATIIFRIKMAGYFSYQMNKEPTFHILGVLGTGCKRGKGQNGA